MRVRALARSLVCAKSRELRALQHSEYSEENANTAWKFGQGESRVSIRVCARARICMCACMHTTGRASPTSVCIPQSDACEEIAASSAKSATPSPRFPAPSPSFSPALRSPSPSPIKAPIRRLMFQVGWVKADTKAIQAIHDHVITHNQRVSVSHSDHSIWNLHIKGVQKEDGGLYMCQINTDPMKSQVYTALNSFKLMQERS